MKILNRAMRIILGGIFILASIDKIAYPPDFYLAIHNIGLVPEVLIKPFTFVIPWIELVVGFWIIFKPRMRIATLAAMSLCLIYVTIVAIKAFSQTTASDCGCFGILPFLDSENIAFLMVRNVIFFGISITIYITSSLIKKKRPNE